MNSKLILLTLAILCIQLINAGIVNQNEETAAAKPKKLKDIKKLTLKAKEIDIDGTKILQLECTEDKNAEGKDDGLCKKYQAGSITCENKNKGKDQEPEFVNCKYSGQKITNPKIELQNPPNFQWKGVDKKNWTYTSIRATYKITKQDGYDPKKDKKVRFYSGLSTGWIVIIIIVIIAVIGGVGGFVYTKTRA